MATVKFNGNEVHTNGTLPQIGSIAPDFKLVTADLSEISLKDYAGKKVVLNIFPSVDTGICATSVRKFNKLASEKENVVVICVSKDLPFALGRFCGAEGLDKVITASDFRYHSFAKDYGVLLTDGPIQGLMARSVIVIDEGGKVIYNQLVDEIKTEPNYDINALE